jgi:hypothetical protein
VQILIALALAVALGTWAAFATRDQISRCPGPKLPLTIGEDGEITLAGQPMHSRKDLAVALFAAAEKKPQPVVDISLAPHGSQRTLGVIVTLAQTAGIKCLVIPNSGHEFTGI